MRFAPRFAAVGIGSTAIDVGIVLVLSTWGLHPVGADLVAVAVASILAFLFHRATTYAAAPERRWYRDTRHWAVAAILALVVDVSLFGIALRNVAEPSLTQLLVAKSLSLAAAFLVRLMMYRRTMFATVRGDQLAPQHTEPAPGDVRLSVVVPAYGEAERIGATIERIRAELDEVVVDGGLEIVVVDDGSSDDTAGAARRGGADLVIALEQNRGKGGAVRAGMLAASGRCIAFTDADLAYSPAQLLGLLHEVEAGWDVVVGSRQHTETTTLVAAGRLREIGGRVINGFTSLVLLGQYRDTQCGIKAFRSDAAQLLFGLGRVDGFAFDVELFHLVERHRLALREVPVEVVNSDRSTVHVVRDAWRLVADLFRIRAAAVRGDYELDQV